jgi:MFS family permease
VDRKRLMIFTDLARALIIGSIPALAALGLLAIWWIYAATFINATLNIGFAAANFAAIPSLVAPDELVTANGRIQASYSTAGILGPLLAGLLLVAIPLPMLLLVDALSFLISAWSLAAIATSFNARRDLGEAATSISKAIREGLSYVLSHPVLRWITLLLLLINFILPTVSAQLVLYAKEWLQASNVQIGFLYASGGVGVAVCSLMAARWRQRWPFGAVALAFSMGENPFSLTNATPDVCCRWRITRSPKSLSSVTSKA